MTSDRSPHLPDPLGSALAVIDAQQAQLWEARIALVAAMSLVARLELAVKASTLPAIEPRAPRSEESPGEDDSNGFVTWRSYHEVREARILEALRRGPLRASDVAREVVGPNATRDECSAIWKVLERLGRQGRVVKTRDRRYQLPTAQVETRSDSWWLTVKPGESMTQRAAEARTRTLKQEEEVSL